MMKLIALLVLAAGSLMGQIGLQCLSDAEICIDVAVTHVPEVEKETRTYLKIV